MAMRFLYGDSSVFPLQYNFLATLEAFVRDAGRAADRLAETHEKRAATEKTIAERNRTLAELETFHRTIAQQVAAQSTHVANPLVVEYAAQLGVQANAIVEGMRRTHAQSNERDQTRLRTESDERRTEIRAALEHFFVHARLPIVETRIALRCEHGQNVITATLTNPEGIEGTYSLSTESLPAWQAPRKVSEFAQGLDWQVGTRKSWFNRTPQPEVVHVDDFYVGGFELAEDVAEIRLRKKPELPDALVFRVARETMGVVAEVERSGEDAAEGALPPLADPDERAELEQLWMLLRAGVTEALSHKQVLTSLTLAGADVFEGDRALGLIRKLVKIFAPTVAEIAKRSPNPAELSLKSEADDGRREEIYLRRVDLERPLLSLRPGARALFAPLTLGAEGGEFEVLVDD